MSGVAGNKVRRELVRGATFLYAADLYEDASSDGCGPAVRGDALDLSSYTTFVAAGRVEGTDTPILVTTRAIDMGAADRPAAVEVQVEAEDARTLPFAEGAEEAFRIDVFAVRPGRREPVLEIQVDVEDSAFGAVR